MQIPHFRKYLEANLDHYLELLRQMVLTNSFTSNAEGVNRLGEMTARVFSHLGFQAEFIQSTTQNYGRHVFLRKMSDPNAKLIALVSHLDTVFSPEEEAANNFTWRVNGDRIYGPGTVDIKGGTLVIFMVLDALHSLAPDLFNRINWLICLDASEEALSLDFTELCKERMSSRTLACLVFEGGIPKTHEFSLVTGRKGRAAYTVSVDGKSAHAGNYHHLGANAIVQLAHTIQKIAAFTDYDRQITFNVGKVSGGSVINRVPHQAEAKVEMRCFSPQVFEDGVASMLGLNGQTDVTSQDGYPCQVSVVLHEQTAPWPRNPGTEVLFELWNSAGDELGLQIVREQRGGLSDGNMLWQHVPTLDGLGPVGDNAHCSEQSPDGSKEQEYVLSSTLLPKALLSILGISKLVNQSEAK